MIKLFMTGLLALILIGCSSLLKFDRVEVPSDLPADGIDVQDGVAVDEPVSTHQPVKSPVRRVPVTAPHPVEPEEEEIPNPCRSIYHPNLKQEIILKLTCMEENYK